MLRKVVMCNPSGCYCALVVKGCFYGEKTGQVRHGQSAHCHIIHHLRFYVASLRETLFCLSQRGMFIQWAKIFCLTQRRNDATLRVIH